MSKKILYLEWESYGNEYMIPAFEEYGYSVVKFPLPRKTEDMRMSAEVTESIVRKLFSDSFEFVFSFNYFPVAAMACKASRIKYVSWTYDSPSIALYSETILYETNRIFIFDSDEVSRLKKLGVENVYYLPLPAAVEAYDGITLNESHHAKYDSDVTFIGAMYNETRNHMFRHLESLNDYAKGYVYGLMNAQKLIYGADILEQALNLSPDIVKQMQDVSAASVNDDGLETIEWIFANYFLARKVTAMERQEIMKFLSDTVIQQRENGVKPWNVRLFTSEKTDDFPGITCGGKIDYYDHMPYAMKCAKINLNITLRSIHTGIPLRAMDILGSGGFLLTNYQADFMEHFIPGEDFVYYDSVEQLPELITYYLDHDRERLEIAHNGHEKVKKDFSYAASVKNMTELL